MDVRNKSPRLFWQPAEAAQTHTFSMSLMLANHRITNFSSVLQRFSLYGRIFLRYRSHTGHL